MHILYTEMEDVEGDLQSKKVKLSETKQQKIYTGETVSHLVEKKQSKMAKPTKTAAAVKKNSAPTTIKSSSAKTKPTTAKMVNCALEDGKSRKGSSLQAIKKYMFEKYNVDPDKVGYLIKKYLKMAVENGEIVQVKGRGASGSFKKAKKETKKPEKKIEKKIEKKTENKIEKKTDEGAKKKIAKPKEKADKDKEKKTKKKETAAVKGEKKSPKKKTKVPAARRKSSGSIIKPPKMKPKTPSKPKVRTLKKQKAA